MAASTPRPPLATARAAPAAAAAAAMRRPPPPLLVLALALLLLLAAGAGGPAPAAAQQLMPFAGQGVPPELSNPNDTIPVYVSAYVDRLMYINDRDYEFEAVMFVSLAWTDPRARVTIAENDARLLADPTANCTTPCQLYPAIQQAPAGGCCDGVWVPWVQFSNLKYLSQDRVMRGAVLHDPEGDSMFAWTIFMGVYLATMDLRAFPFDTQRLHVQMEIPGWSSGGRVRLVPSSSGTRLFNTNNDGDALSGWKVQAVRITNYTWSLCSRYTTAASVPSHPDDPSPLVPDFLWGDDVEARKKSSTCAKLLAKNPDGARRSVYTVHNGEKFRTATTPFEPLQINGVIVQVIVWRYRSQWIMTAVLPIIATTYLGFACFAMQRDDLTARLTAVVTLLLAQAAIQFVAAQQLPNSSYMTALQQLIGAGYVVLIMIGLESVIIWYITTLHSSMRRYKEHRDAQKKYEAALELRMAKLRAQMEALIAEQELAVSKGSPGVRARSRSLLLPTIVTMARRTASGPALAGANSQHAAAMATLCEEHEATGGEEGADGSGSGGKDGNNGNNGNDGNDAPPSNGQAPAACAGACSPFSARSAPALSGPSSRRLRDDELYDDRGGGGSFGGVSVGGDAAAADAAPAPAPAAVGPSALRCEQRSADLQRKMRELEEELTVHHALSGRWRSKEAVHEARERERERRVLRAELPRASSVKLTLLDLLKPAWFTRLRVYLKSLLSNEAFCDHLAHQLNRWLCIVQLLLYSIALFLIFFLSWWLYARKD